MMKAICIVFVLANQAVALKPHPKGTTLRQWIKTRRCLNLASQPLMNTQFAQLGALDALNDAGLLEKVTGVSGVSSGAFVMAMAASKNFTEKSKKFREIWPGWGHLVPDGGDVKDPEMTMWYKKRVLNRVLPASFEELRIPLAVTAVAYDDDEAAQTVDEEHSQPMVISDGNLADAVVVSSSAMIGEGCPNCKNGFSAKEFRGHWPVADGFLKDEYGTLGLAALPPCESLLHLQPQNFAQQLASTKNQNLDTQPKSVVTLGIDQPSSSIMSMNWNMLFGKLNQVRRLMLQGSMPLKDLANNDDVWEKVLYENAYDHMMEKLDEPMKIEPQDTEEHYFVDLELKQHWDNIRSEGERKWDRKFDNEHTVYWERTIPRRDNMVNKRNALMKAGQLSYRACGNGLGAPKCNRNGKKQPRYKNGKPVAGLKYADKVAPHKKVSETEQHINGLAKLLGWSKSQKDKAKDMAGIPTEDGWERTDRNSPKNVAAKAAAMAAEEAARATGKGASFVETGTMEEEALAKEA